MQILRAILYANWYIATIAVVMSWHTCLVWGITMPDAWWGFVFCSTLCSYNLHWYLTHGPDILGDRMRWTNRNRSILLLFLIAAIWTDSGFFYALRAWWPYLIPLIISTFLYTAPKIDYWPFRYLRGLAIGKTVFLSVSWVLVTVVLPISIGHGTWTLSTGLFVFNRWLLIHAICALFDYRDRAEDRRSGILNMVTHLKEGYFSTLFYIGMAVFFISCFYVLKYSYSIYYIKNTIAMILPGLLLLATFSYSRRTRSDLWYYGVLDGLMMGSGICELVF